MTKVFIGSSTEAKPIMEKLAEWIEDAGFEPRPWTDSTVFPLGATAFDSLHAVAKSVQAAIFLFTEDDLTWYRSDKTKSPRDNVLLEYGLFAGVLGERRAAVAVSGKPKMASDLAGITYLSLDREAAAKNKLKQWLIELSRPAEVGGRLLRPRSPFYSSGKQSLFEIGTHLIMEARRRVALVARTPIPIVGTRPYGEPAHAIAYESTQLEEYMRLLEQASTGKSLAFRCVASVPALCAELRENSSKEFRSTVRRNISHLYAASKASGSKFQIRWTEDRRGMTFVVADDKFLIWFKDNSGENVWISDESDVTARALWDESEKLSFVRPLSTIQRAMGLGR